MRIALIGSDIEENLGLGMVGASLVRAGHRVFVIPFNDADEIDAVVDQVRQRGPRMVGLGMQFQHRSTDFVWLARALRQVGFEGHVTAGGQYATLAGDEVLKKHHEFDSIVLHEGEEASVELAAAVQRGAPLDGVSGLLIRKAQGVVRTGPRALCADLDTLPFSLRYRAPNLHLGIPFFPIWGSRGCWGACAFCGITTYYRDAKRNGGGRQLRLRSASSIADEIAILWQAAGGACIVCFHDDTFLLPRPADTLTRVREIRDELDARRVGQVGIVGKCRPETVTDDLCRALKELGVFRLYVGIENASQPGQDHLNRRTKTPQLRSALRSMRRSGIFGCYNLLVFEPDTTIADVRENAAFIREHASQPMNFCRAEPYHKTPLYERVKARGVLSGSYLGWDYRIHDDRAELLYRICAAVFDDRNFMPAGVANRCMGLGYVTQVLRTFYDTSSLAAARLVERAGSLMQEVSLDTANFLDEAIVLAETSDLENGDAIERQAARLGLRILAHDKLWHQRLDELLGDMNDFVASRRRPPRPARVWREALQGAALASAVAIGAPACGGDTSSDHRQASGGTDGSGAASGSGGGSGGWVADPLASGGGLVVDEVPSSGGVGGWISDMVPDGGTGGLVVDMVPTGGTGGLVATGGTGGLVVDMVPTGGTGGLIPSGGTGGVGAAGEGGEGGEGGIAGAGGIAGSEANGTGGLVDDPLPTGGVGGWVDDMVPESGGTSAGSAAFDATEHWKNTAPRRSPRSSDLPFHAPPEIRLRAQRGDSGIAVVVHGGPAAMTIRWDPDGEIEGEGREVVWHPTGEEAQLRVAARTHGGIAVTSIRAACL